MNVLSLFDGMSCGRLALDRLGIEVDQYYAAEIDKYAIQVTQENWPETIQLGDVTQIKGKDLPKIDLLLGGSPCQGFSFAGKQLAFDDPRSALFFEFVRILKECEPKYFLLENVKMKKEFLDIISQQVGAEPILINSALVSAQNRQRYYWTNLPGVEQPENRGIVLRDILETNPESYTLMSDKFTKRQEGRSCLVDINKEKASNLSAMEYVKNGRQGDYLACDDTGIPKDLSETHDTPKQVGTASDINGHDILKRVYSPDGKAPTLTTNGGGNREPKVVGGAWRGRSLDKDGKNVDWKSTTPKQMLELRKDEKSNALSQVTKDNVVVSDELPLSEEDVGERIVVDEEKKQLIIKEATNKGFTVIEDGDCFDITHFDSKTRRGRSMKYKCNALTAGAYNYMRYEHPKDESSDVYWRKLTCVECERLQTVPDDYTASVSNTQRYKMLGNGWTIEVIAHILKNMKTLEEGGKLPASKGQTLFDF